MFKLETLSLNKPCWVAELVEDEPHKVFDKVNVTVRCWPALYDSKFGCCNLARKAAVLNANTRVGMGMAGLAAAAAVRWWPKAPARQ